MNIIQICCMALIAFTACTILGRFAYASYKEKDFDQFLFQVFLIVSILSVNIIASSFIYMNGGS